MAKTRKRKAATVAGVGALTAALLLGGTFAWQSISQMALNENRASVNPGARLHDDYNGNYGSYTVNGKEVKRNIKRVYVENFAEDDVTIIARVRLDEYMETGTAAGHKNEETQKTASGNFVKKTGNGIVEVSEKTDGTSGKVTISVKPIPYTGNTVSAVTGATDNGNGIYTYEYTPNDPAVTIEVTFAADGGTKYSFETIEPAKAVVATANDGSTKSSIDDVSTWKTYIPKFDANGALTSDPSDQFRKYVDLTLGSKDDVYYMPTFNKNKDSLKADINGTYAGADNDPMTPADAFTDFVDYSETANQTKTDTEIYDNDANDVEDNGVTQVTNVKHTAAKIEASKSKVISMEEWLKTKETGAFWVYDTDGWAYWAEPLEAGEATGLLLSKNEMTGKPENNWYYGMNVVAQFVTPKDLGKKDNTGFYKVTGEEPSTDAELLLSVLGAGDTISSTAGTMKNGVLTFTSGATATLSVKDSGALAMLSRTTGTQNGWTVLNNKDAEGNEILALTDKGDETAEVTAKAPGEVYVIYRGTNKTAAQKVTVDYATYTITKEAVDGDITDPLLSNAMTLEKDDAGTQNAKLTIEGYFKADNVYYQVKIGKSAFTGNKTLTTLILKDGIKEVGYAAFYGCVFLRGTLIIPASVTTISGDAFMGTKFENLQLNEGLKTIGDNSFRYTNLTNVYIPASVTTIFGSAFYGSMVTNITVAPDSINFYFDTSDSVLYTKNKTKIISRLENGIEAYEIPDGVVEASDSFVRGNTSLKTLIIPKSVKKIGMYGMEGCYNLENIYYEGTQVEWDAITKGNGWDQSMGRDVDDGTQIIYESTGPQE